MAKNEAKIKFSAETGDFNQQIKSANDEMSMLRAELKLNETQMKTTGTSADGLKNKHKILSSQLDAAKNKTDALNKKVEKAVEIFGENSTEATKLKTQLLNAKTAEEKIKQEVNKCNEELKEQKTSSDNLKESLDGVDKEARETSEGFTIMKGAAADLVADGISSVVDGFINVGKEAFTMSTDIDQATNDFIAQTGLSAEAAENFESVMIDIYNNNFGESFDDIADSMATVRTNMGNMDNGQLQSATQNALLLRDTFEFDVNESTRAASMLMTQFGVDSDTAFSLIASGAQHGLNKNGDLLDVINEYSVQFKDAGFGAEEMFGMLVNGSDAGTWSVDKLGDAVKEFNIRASDGTVSASIIENAEAFGLTKTEAESLASEVESGSVEAYKKLRDQLSGVDDDTKRYQIGVEMFGTMWEDLGENTVMALLDTESEISATTGALDELNAVKYDDLGSAIEGIKRNLQTSVTGPIKDNVMPAVNEFVQDVDWEGVGNTIGEVFGVAVDGALAMVEGVREAVSWMKEHQGAVAAVATVVGVLAAAITAYNVVQGIKAAMEAANVTTVWALVSAHVAQAAAAVAAVAPYVLVAAAIAAVIAVIVLCVKHWDTIKAKITEVAQKVKDKVLEIKNNISQKLNEARQKAVEIFNNIKTGITDKISQAKTKVVELFNKIRTGVAEKITLLYTKVTTVFSNLKNKITTMISTAKNNVVTFFNNMRTGVAEKITLLYSKVTSVFSTLKNKITTMISTAKNNVVNFFEKIRTGVATKVLALYSNVTSIFSTLKNKISTMISTARTNILNIIDGLRTNFTSKVTSIRDKVSGIFSNLKDKLTGPVDQARSIIERTVDKIKGIFNFSWSLPKLKIPKISVTGGKAPYGIAGQGSLPKFSITWHKEGAIFKRPTVFDTRSGLHGVGEAGAEAILPIDKLKDYIADTVEDKMNVVNLGALADAIERLADRPIDFNINGRKFAEATAGDSDRVNGLRSSFLNRGLALG